MGFQHAHPYVALDFLSLEVQVPVKSTCCMLPIVLRVPTSTIFAAGAWLSTWKRSAQQLPDLLVPGPAKKTNDGGGGHKLEGFIQRFGIFGSNFQLGVSKNRGTPKWMVYNGKPY